MAHFPQVLRPSHPLKVAPPMAPIPPLPPPQFSGTQYADVATMTLGLEINDGDPVLLLAHGLTNY